MAMMQIDLAFGKTGITADLPEGFRYRVLEARSAQPLADWQGALESALDRPIGSAPLAELARGKRKDHAIVVCLSGRGDKDAAEIARLKGTSK